MNKFDKRVRLCLVIVACSFWVNLAWIYFSDQPEAAFYVGAVVVAWGLTCMVDIVLLGIAIFSAGYAIFTKQVVVSDAGKRWLPLVLLVCLSFYLEIQMDLHLHPFLKR